MKIVHLITLDKFIPPFIDFVKENFNLNDHKFLIVGNYKNSYGLEFNESCLSVKNILQYLALIKYISTAEKIIIHGLWNKNVVHILYAQPWLLKKCYWIMWGGDFYSPEKSSHIKRSVIKRIGNLVTYIKGDIDFVRENYQAKGRYIECFVYLSNIFSSGQKIEKTNKDTLIIQIGNSADPSNCHLEVFEKIKNQVHEQTEIYVPLSYGDMDYAKQVVEAGTRLFGKKFNPMLSFLSLAEYKDFLNKIDIAIFGHKRQQALGNIINLLGLGKTVVMRNTISTWNFFQEKNINLLNFSDFELKKISKQESISNQKVIMDYFSKDKLLKQLKYLFDIKK